ncbi:MAG: sigma-70 family RNA polymerase sigma factor [Candidatus Nealsonbacteria bacterium]|nr:sigma-70 family RNA polymerase sigma factor [Candidatus Nealsonbacteria bacterium]
MTGPSRSLEELINECQGLVRSLATTIHRKLPPGTELDDLVAYGQIGLAEAAKNFDPSHGSRFSTFAYYRIRGAIYDGLSKMSWFSRSEYKRVRTEQMANEVIRAENEQDEEPLKTGCDGDMRWFRDLSRALTVVHLAMHAGGEDNPGASLPPDLSTPDPSAIVIGREIGQILHKLIDALPEAAGDLIRATYFEGLTLQEAGKRLGVSKSWASRLHARTLQQLARSLKLLGVAS